MGLPILFGWGKKGKEVGYIGIDKCPNCKNYAHLKLYEYANNVNVYFVPIAKFNKKIYLVCPICDAAYELNDDLKSSFLETSLNTLDMNTTDYIWEETKKIVSKNFEKYFEEYKDDWAKKILEKCAKDISKEVDDKDYIKRVSFKYLEAFVDQDRPK